MHLISSVLGHGSCFCQNRYPSQSQCAHDYHTLLITNLSVPQLCDCIPKLLGLPRSIAYVGSRCQLRQLHLCLIRQPIYACNKVLHGLLRHCLPPGESFQLLIRLLDIVPTTSARGHSALQGGLRFANLRGDVLRMSQPVPVAVLTTHLAADSHTTTQISGMTKKYRTWHTSASLSGWAQQGLPRHCPGQQPAWNCLAEALRSLHAFRLAHTVQL